MLKISVSDSPLLCRLIVEGTLVTPWDKEFATACEKARADLHGRELVVDLRGVTTIGSEIECVFLELIRDKVKFQCGVYIKEVLRQLALQTQKSPLFTIDTPSDSETGG